MEQPIEYYIAKLVQENNEAEAVAIKDYSDFLGNVAESTLDDESKEYITTVINEIIADELNHQQRLQELYTALTNIEPNKD